MERVRIASRLPLWKCFGESGVGEIVADVYQAGAGAWFHRSAKEVIADRAIELLGGKRGDYALCHPIDLMNYSQWTMPTSPGRGGWRLHFYLMMYFARLQDLPNHFH